MEFERAASGLPRSNSGADFTDEELEEFCTAGTEGHLEPGEQYTISPDTHHWFAVGEDDGKLLIFLGPFGLLLGVTVQERRLLPEPVHVGALVFDAPGRLDLGVDEFVHLLAPVVVRMRSDVPRPLLDETEALLPVAGVLVLKFG